MGRNRGVSEERMTEIKNFVKRRIEADWQTEVITPYLKKLVTLCEDTHNEDYIDYANSIIDHFKNISHDLDHKVTQPWINTNMGFLLFAESNHQADEQGDREYFVDVEEEIVKFISEYKFDGGIEINPPSAPKEFNDDEVIAGLIDNNVKFESGIFRVLEGEIKECQERANEYIMYKSIEDLFGGYKKYFESFVPNLVVTGDELRKHVDEVVNAAEKSQGIKDEKQTATKIKIILPPKN